MGEGGGSTLGVCYPHQPSFFYSHLHSQAKFLTHHNAHHVDQQTRTRGNARERQGLGVIGWGGELVRPSTCPSLHSSPGTIKQHLPSIARPHKQKEKNDDDEEAVKT